MKVTFTGRPHEIMQQYEQWLNTLDMEQTLLYNRIIITGNKTDKVIQEIAIANKGGIKSIDNEIKQCYNVEKKRFTDGFYITGIQLKEENKMTHEKYNELQKKMDKLASDFVDEMAEIEKNGGEMTSEWLDNHMSAIYTWVDTDDEKVLAELHADYLKLKEMLEL